MRGTSVERERMEFRDRKERRVTKGVSCDHNDVGDDGD